jgi:diguanylate cyclase (GGDEF)-like protein
MPQSAAPRSRDPWIVTAIALLAAVATYLLVAAIREEVGGRRILVLFLVLTLAAGIAALIGWKRSVAGLSGRMAQEAAERERLAQELQQREAEAHKAEQEAERCSNDLQRAESELGRQEAEERTLRNERDVEREWNRELRAKLTELHSKQGPLGDPHDIPEMVLRIAITLLEAEKGVLLSRDEQGGDELKVDGSHGFENDPGDSALAQRFAREVIQHDKIVRENDWRTIEHEKKTIADEEIDNLVAIPIYIGDEFHGVVVCANNPQGFESHQEDVLLALGDHAGAILENANLRGALRSSYLGTVRMLADAIEAKDSFLRGHSEDVSAYVAAVADHLGLDAREKEELLFGSLLHDIGKVGISERILFKPARLTDEEFNIIKLHPRIGYRLVQQVPLLDAIAPGILHHHERWDGSGYPSGLSGEEIPLSARIICIADSFSAMTAERPYSKALSVPEACEELKRCAGTQFDPTIVRIFVEEVEKQGESAMYENGYTTALTDPELKVRRREGEPVVGMQASGLTDNLTLLYSHRYFMELVEAETQRAAVQEDGFFILLVDLVNLAQVNQRDGYGAGDELLKKAGKVLEEAAAKCDGTAARFSGRRFALIGPSSQVERSGELATAIQNAMGDGVRVSTAAWRQGDSAPGLIARATADAKGAVALGESP